MFWSDNQRIPLPKYTPTLLVNLPTRSSNAKVDRRVRPYSWVENEGGSIGIAWIFWVDGNASSRSEYDRVYDIPYFCRQINIRFC